MYSDYAGSRDPHPLRRRSISSPRVVPFSPFTPSLAHRSPFVGRVSSFSPTTTVAESPVTPTLKQEFLFLHDTPKLKQRFRSPQDWHHALRIHLKVPLGRTIITFAFLMLWGLTWYLIDRYSAADRLSDLHKKHSHPPNNGSIPYYIPYLKPMMPSPDRLVELHPGQEDDILPRNPETAIIQASDVSFDSYTGKSSLTVVLSCPPNDLASALPRLLYTLSARYLSVGGEHATVLICPSTQSREALRIVEKFTLRQVYVRVAALDPLSSDTEAVRQRKMEMSLVHTAAHLPSEWALILNADGFANLPLSVITLLHHPPQSIHIPFGPRGIVMSPSGPSCVSNRLSSGVPTPAAYLVPPFIVRARSLRRIEHVFDVRNELGVWGMLGLKIATMSFSADGSGASSSTAKGVAMGGLIVGAGDPSHLEDWCPRAMEQAASNAPNNQWESTTSTGIPLNDRPNTHRFEYLYSTLRDAHKASPGTLAILLPGIEDLIAFSPALCRSSRLPYTLRILLYGQPAGQYLDITEGCHIHYDTLSSGSSDYETLDDWLREQALNSDAILAVADNEIARKAIELGVLDLDEFRKPPVAQSVLIWLPSKELAFMEWVGTLTIAEWRSELVRL